ncbi:hypothetical protein, partial [Burkholderia pseudomallei]|uniref:hypothetical protein n=2 Tax=Burkholderia pseudomallei TaxID=28450 RepID=UPI0005726DAF
MEGAGIGDHAKACIADALIARSASDALAHAVGVAGARREERARAVVAVCRRQTADGRRVRARVSRIRTRYCAPPALEA